MEFPLTLDTYLIIFCKLLQGMWDYLYSCMIKPTNNLHSYELNDKELSRFY